MFREPLFAEQIGPDVFRVTLIQGNFYCDSDFSLEGEFEMHTTLEVYSGHVEKQL